MRIRFDKVDGFTRVYDAEFKHLVLFDYGLFDNICDTIKYLISGKSGITNSINHNFGKITIDSYNSLPIENILTFHNVIILIKSVVNRDKNNYYYNSFLEKALYKGKSNRKYLYMNVCILKMLYFERIDVSEGIDVNKTSASTV